MVSAEIRIILSERLLTTLWSQIVLHFFSSER